MVLFKKRKGGLVYFIGCITICVSKEHVRECVLVSERVHMYMFVRV